VNDVLEHRRRQLCAAVDMRLERANELLGACTIAAVLNLAQALSMIDCALRQASK
jgi:hypothetical protein